VTLEALWVDELPTRLVGDKAYDSDPLDQLLAAQGIDMIAPHRRNRCKPRTQDRRKLRRYRRLVVRYERHAENYLAFAQLACILILLKHCF